MLYLKYEFYFMKIYEVDEIMQINYQLKTLIDVADTLPILLSYIDKNLVYQFNNKTYETLLGIERQALKGKAVKDIIGTDAYNKSLPYYQRVLAGELVEYKEVMTLTNGSKKAFHVKYIPDIHDGVVNGFFALIKDITGEKTSLKLLKAIHEVIHQPHVELQETLQQLLKLARDYLVLDIAIIAQVKSNNYTVYALSSNIDGIAVGDQFNLVDAYCSLTLAADDVVSTICAKDLEKFSNHPCYKNMKLETYIGIPLMVNNETWGTLNFSSPLPRQEEFSDIEVELLRLLATAIENFIYRQQELTNIEQEKKALEVEANLDPLTKLPNRNYIEKIFKNLPTSANDFLSKPSCICLIDIDNFKQINDTFGHQAGDNALKEVSEVCRHYLRKPDLIARFGGDELLVLLYDVNLENAEEVLSRLRETIANKTFELIPGQEIKITISGGLTQYDLTTSFQQLLASADKALYSAKQAGRNQIIAV